MSARPRGLLIAIEQYDPAGEIPNQLAGTKATADAFRNWLVTKKGVDPADIVECVSDTFPAPHTTKSAIVQQLSQLQADWQNAASELYVFLSGHGLTQEQTGQPLDYVITSDFQSFEFSGNAAIAVQEMQRKLRESLGPGEHYYFVDICRTDTPDSEVELGRLGLRANRSNLGTAAYFTLFSVRAGSTASVKSGFGDAVVQGLEGKGRAKQWVENELYVTFDALLRYVQARVKPQEVDQDRKGTGLGRILVIRPVVSSPCEIEIVGANDDDAFELRVTDLRERLVTSQTFTGARLRLDLPPDDYLIEVKASGTPLERVAPPAGALDLFDACTVKFHNRQAAPAAVTATLDLEFPHVANARIIAAGSGDAIDVVHPESVALPPGDYSIEMYDRGVVTERVHRRLGFGDRTAVELGAPRRSPAHESIRHEIKKQGGLDTGDPRLLDFSESLGGSIANQDLTLWLTLLGASRIVGHAGDYHKLSGLDLQRFGDVARGSAAMYVLAGFEDEESRVFVHAGRTATALAAVTPLEHVLHARLDAQPGPSLLTFEMPEANTRLTLATHALPDRVTLVVLVHGDDGRWYVRQFLLPVMDTLPSMPFEVRQYFERHNPLQAIHSFAQAQTLFTREHDIQPLFSDYFWNELLHGKWLDPVISLIACYQLIRRGEQEKAFLPEVLHNLRAYFPGLADTEAIARMAGKPSTPQKGTPMILDGALALPEHLVEERDGQVLDYRAPWTMWVGRIKRDQRRDGGAP